MADDAQALLLQVSCDISSIERQMKRAGIVVDTETTGIEHRFARMKSNVEHSAGSINVAGALDRIFDRSRLAVLDAGAERISVFGSALEELGPAGITAGAGIAALGIALEQAHEATEYAEQLRNTARAIHASTDELQIFRFGLQEAGGDAAGADAALGGFNTVLGQAKEGLRGATQAFHSLGIEPAQVRGFTDFRDALPEVIARINQLRDSSQRSAVEAQLGLTAMAPLIERLGSNADEVKSKLDEMGDAAVGNGQVLSRELIERGAEANEKFNQLTHIIQNDLRAAFIELGPTINGVLQFLVNNLSIIADLIDRISSIENQRGSTLQRELRENEAAMANIPAGPEGNLARQDYQRQHDRLTSAVAINQFRDQTDAVLDHGGQEGGTRSLLPRATHTTTPHGPRGPNPEDVRRRGLDAMAAGQTDLLNAQKAELQAQLGLTDNAGERAVIQGRILDIEHQEREVAERKAIDDLNSQVVRGQISRHDADAAIASRKFAEDRQEQAEVSQRTLQAQEEDFAASQRTLSDNAELVGLGIRARDAQASITGTAQDRAASAVQSFRDQQQIDAANYSEQQHELYDRKAITSATERQRIAAFAAAQKAELAAQQDQQNRQANPLFAYGHPLDGLNTDLQGAAVDGLQAFNTGLVDAITGAKSLGQVFHDVSLQIISDLLKIAIEREITEPLANAIFGSGGKGGGLLSTVLSGLHLGGIPGKAVGTDNWQGGLTWVGESGKELLNLPKGSQIIPGSQVAQMSAGRSGGHTVVQPIFNDFSGAVVTEDLMREANANASRVAAQAGQAAYRQAKRDAPSWVVQRQRERRSA